MSLSYAIASRVKDYFMMMKFTLTFMVVFSCVVAYLLVPGVEFDLIKVLLLFAGGILVSGSANIINQILEKETDKLMARTAPRPLPAGRLSISEAAVVSVVTGLAGILILGFGFNWLSAMVSLVSLVLYGFVYTPWKKWNSLAVLVGAVPGALPPLIGWVAGAGSFSEGGWALFAIQFLWQFPHFWAIAWVAHTDYTRAGFKLMPTDRGPGKMIAMQAAMYTMLLIPAGVAPYLLGITGAISAVVAILIGGFYLYRAIELYRKCDVPSARKLMFGSYIYLAVILLALLFDKVKL
ncbi:heme o synthase [Chitinophaga sp. GCM10012297]|uniref:Protoheme IX farnesyltransferase n=1 Tax=Chitinophaga chungangae TaxID=2821488 RepID=A0ABS3YEL8_9BACT|nr:heme o synthase [Chitinophaga chungangae]MBO9153131.1 heme o synthase [Chitinophaga chungangae]